MTIRKNMATALLLFAGFGCFAVATPGCSSSTENTVAPPAEPVAADVAKEQEAHYGGKASKPSG